VLILHFVEDDVTKVRGERRGFFCVLIEVGDMAAVDLGGGRREGRGRRREEEEEGGRC